MPSNSISSGAITTRPALVVGWLRPHASRTKRPSSWRWSSLSCALVLAIIAAVVVRGCNYRVGIPLAYSGYFFLQVLLPGVVAMAILFRQPLSVMRTIALAIPTGFALEIAAYLGSRALHAPWLMPLLPLGWAVIGIVAHIRGMPVTWHRTPPRSGAIIVALGVLSLITVLSAAGHMYAAAPLVGGLPQRPIFHDWTYLLSRAAAIKNLWPLEEPSLAGTALQYHYFLMVHAASAATSTGIDLTYVLLRLAPIPLGVVLIAQAYVLGTRLSGSRWVGVLGAFLLFVPGEISVAADYGHLTFLGFFVRWLYVSPTFLFGLVFFGAIIIAITEVEERFTVPTSLWLLLLAGAATAAKGPVAPVLIAALGLYAAYRWATDRRVPTGLLAALGAITCGFAAVYALTLSDCGAGDAEFQPFRLCEITAFWDHHAVFWQRALKRGLHAPVLGTWLGKSAVAACILAGTAGLKVAAIPFLAIARRHPGRRIAIWCAALLVSSMAFGLSLHFDGDNEIYFLFLANLPLAAVAAAAYGTVAAWIHGTWRRRDVPRRQQVFPWITATVGGLAVAAVAAAQVATTIRCEVSGVRDWANFSPSVRINDDLRPLYEVTEWLRSATERNAILVSNAFTVETVGRDRGIPVDHVTVGVNYTFSALTERRLWVEGPAYLLDTAEARSRLVAASRYFHGGGSLQRKLPADVPVYIVVDRDVPNSRGTQITDGILVFANVRFEVYRAAWNAPGRLVDSS